MKFSLQDVHQAFVICREKPFEEKPDEVTLGFYSGLRFKPSLEMYLDIALKNGHNYSSMLGWGRLDIVPLADGPITLISDEYSIIPNEVMDKFAQALEERLKGHRKVGCKQDKPEDRSKKWKEFGFYGRTI